MPRTGEIIYTINIWMSIAFLAAADFLMILRVWAMYNRSKLVLGILLSLFSLEIVSTVVAASINSNPNNMPVTTSKIMDFSLCEWQTRLPITTEVTAAVQMAHGAVVCVLAIAQFVRQSFQMYRVTNQWQLNRYMNLLTKHGILYFLCICLFNVIQELTVSGNFPTGWKAYLLFILQYVSMYTLTPRFVLRIRQLYARDTQRRCGEGIDTGFGLSLSSQGADGTVMVFADARD
ncbi:hypothetical protein V8E55_003459 [Tylopilus felleus]